MACTRLIRGSLKEEPRYWKNRHKYKLKRFIKSYSLCMGCGMYILDV